MKITEINKYIITVGIVILLLAVGLSGCLGNDGSKETKGDISTKSSQEKILGMWSNTGSLDNITYSIVYEFFSNSSFFTGLWNVSSSSYDSSVWGSYGLNENDEKIFFNITGDNPSNSTLKYLFSDDGNSLTFFYGDQGKSIVFTRIS